MPGFHTRRRMPAERRRPAPFVPDERGANAVSGVCPGRCGARRSPHRPSYSPPPCIPRSYPSAHSRSLTSKRSGQKRLCPFRPRRKGRERSERGMPGAERGPQIITSTVLLATPMHPPLVSLRSLALPYPKAKQTKTSLPLSSPTKGARKSEANFAGYARDGRAGHHTKIPKSP